MWKDYETSVNKKGEVWCFIKNNKPLRANTISYSHTNLLFPKNKHRNIGLKTIPTIHTPNNSNNFYI